MKTAYPVYQPIILTLLSNLLPTSLFNPPVPLMKSQKPLVSLVVSPHR